jgi:hypothetical protein
MRWPDSYSKGCFGRLGPVVALHARHVEPIDKMILQETTGHDVPSWVSKAPTHDAHHKTGLHAFAQPWVLAIY